MLRTLRSFKPAEALPRMIADFVLVHVCMLASIELAVLYHSRFGDGASAAEILAKLTGYYVAFFWPLSALFPAIFLAGGFYTLTRHYSDRAKAIVLLRGSAVAALVFLAANYLLFRDHLIARSVALPFCALTGLALAGARFLKSTARDFFVTAATAPAAVKAVEASERILVVGGAGYVGSLAVRRLLDNGRRVRVLDSLVYGDGALRDTLGHPNLELMVGDCRNIQSVVAAVKGVDAVLHLAAIVGDPACEQDRQSALEINYAATRMLIEIAKGHGISRFAFASSCSVYGATDEVMDENSSVQPISLYAQTKVDSERALLEARTASFHPVIARLATVFGLSPRPRFDLVVNLLTAKAHQEGVITVFNGEQWRPFIHVDDVARGLIALLEAPVEVVSGQIYNLGDSRLNHTLAQVADKIREIFPLTRVQHIENSDRRNYRVRFDKIRDQVGFRAHRTLADGIVELRRAFDERSILDYTDICYHNQKYLKAAGSPSHEAPIDPHVMAAFSAALLSYETAAPELTTQ
jgi:nucleoside-diphosphate-sugar epimerase